MKLVRLAAVAVLLAQSSLPAALAQGWAWASMVRGGQSFGQAVAGQTPCGLCLKIRNAKPAGSMAACAAAPLDWSALAAVSAAGVEVPGVSVEASPRFSSFDSTPADPPPPRSLPS